MVPTSRPPFSAFIRVHLRFHLALLMAMLVADQIAAQSLRPGRLSKEETAALTPGLRLDLSHTVSSAKDTRISRVAALHVPKGTGPTPFLDAGSYDITLSGYLKVPLKGSHTFYVHATNSFALIVNGTIVLAHATDKPIDAQVADVALVKGYNTLEIRSHISPERDSTLRVEWSGGDFLREPLSTDGLFTRGDEPTLLTALQQRAGRELFATRSCLKCHALDDPLLAASRQPMPELAFTAPSLKGIGSRVTEAWLRDWILNPKSLRPTATMPHVLTGDAATQTQAAADIAAYLATVTTADLPATKSTEEQVAEGIKLFENLGCVACHNTKPNSEDDSFSRQSLHFVQAKFAPGQLHAFLKAPHEHYPWSRMPDFKLSEQEAATLTAFLQSRAQGELEIAQDAPVGDAARGKTLYNTSGCIACHVIAETGADKKLTLQADRLDRGCLTPSRGKAPDFGFAATQSAALQEFLAAELNSKASSSLLRETPAEFSQRQVQTLNCVACHRRDGANSVLSAVLQEEGEQGLTPEVLPLLTWSGEKLKPAWSEKLIAGALDQRARPWLRARMPAFPTRAKLLAVGLSHEHGFAVDESPAPVHDAALAKIGQQLVGENNGFSCIKCHGIGKRPPLQPFEAPGINLVDAAERLRYTYYPRWMMDPPRVDVLTKMPKFAADGKTTGVTAVFDGHAARQYEALWHYIQTLPRTEAR